MKRELLFVLSRSRIATLVYYGIFISRLFTIRSSSVIPCPQVLIHQGLYTLVTIGYLSWNDKSTARRACSLYILAPARPTSSQIEWLLNILLPSLSPGSSAPTRPTSPPRGLSVTGKLLAATRLTRSTHCFPLSMKPRVVAQLAPY
jgi:hypothetical protein